MRKVVVYILMMLPVAVFGQTNKSQLKEKIQNYTDSLSEDQKETLFNLTEEIFLIGIDSIVADGRYLYAVELMDSMQNNWENLIGKAPSPRTYLTKGNILMHLEEWRELVKTTEECLAIHRETINERMAAIMCVMQGNAHRNLEEYREAIRSYENGAWYYNKTGDIDCQGDMLCSMAKCYMELGKYTMALSFYKKGMDKYFGYFGTTRSELLRNHFIVKDPYKQIVLGVFAAHLVCLAVYEQDYGTRQAMKEYLLMAAHCGSDFAKSEYERIFGY